jgi:hypothetical protein
MPKCDHEGCPRAATVRQGMGGLCSEHFLRLYGVRSWNESTNGNWHK